MKRLIVTMNIERRCLHHGALPFMRASRAKPQLTPKEGGDARRGNFERRAQPSQASQVEETTLEGRNESAASDLHARYRFWSD